MTARAPSLDGEIDRLYAGPLAEFVGQRNELAKRLRAGGDREAATSVKGLAKPSLTAWVVNRLHHEQPELMAELMAAGERIRAAHLSDPAALGGAVEAHRGALAELVDLARETLEAEGHPAGKAQVRRITGTLEALAAIDPESLGVTPGRLTRDLEPPGFGAFGAVFPAPPPAKSRAGKRATDRSAPGRKAATGAKAKAGGARAGKAKGAKAEARKAEAEAERKKSAALKRRISAADAKRQRAAEKARESERALRAADKALKAAERGAERKRRHAKEAEREAARAEKDADLARAALRKARERDERARETLEARETELASLRQWLASS